MVPTPGKNLYDMQCVNKFRDVHNNNTLQLGVTVFLVPKKGVGVSQQAAAGARDVASTL